jgi:hypothetical protein
MCEVFTALRFNQAGWVCGILPAQTMPLSIARRKHVLWFAFTEFFLEKIYGYFYMLCNAFKSHVGKAKSIL